MEISGDDILGMLDISGDVDGDMDGLTDISGDDILGDALVGDMDGDIDGLSDAIVGRLFKRKKKQSAVKRALVARKIAKGTLVSSQVPKAERNLPLGFVQTGVAANALATVTQQPQLPFKGYRLSVPSIISNFFTIVDLKVGKDSQLVAAGALPASSFNEVATGDNVQMDTASVGQIIALTVQNIDGAAAHDFRATIFGKTILMGPKC